MNHFENFNLNSVAGIPSIASPVRPLFEHIKDHTYALRIDNSTLENFQTCSRASKYYNIDRRQRPGSAAMVFGSAIHLGLETIYRHGYASIATACDKALTYFDENVQANDEEWRTSALVVDTLVSYAEKYGKDDPIHPVADASGKLLVEIPFSLVLGEIAINQDIPHYDAITSHSIPRYIENLIILWSGRIDIAANYGDDSIYVVDHKTTSIGGSQFFADFMLSQQMIGYNWALRQLLPDHKIMGTVVNAIIRRKPTRTGTGLELERQVYFHQDWHVEEWLSDINEEISRFVHSFLDNSWPKATKWCFGKYGKCPYHDVCTLPPSQRSFMLNSGEYTNVTWSPLDDR